MSYIQDRWAHKDGTPTERAGQGKRYRVRYLDPDGRWKSRSFARKGDADRFKANTDAEIIKGSYVDPGAGRITLEEYAAYWLSIQSYRTATTPELVARRLRLHIVGRIGHYQLYRLKPSVIKAWTAGLVSGAGTASGRKLSITYVRQLLALLSAILDAAVDDQRIAANPCKLKSVRLDALPDRKVVPWERSQIVFVREGLPEMHRALSDVGSGLGLRQGEALGLSPDDIDWLRGVVHVERQIVIVSGRLCFSLPKFGRTRDVPLPESVKLRLSRHLEQYPAVTVSLPWESPEGKRRAVPLMFTSLHGKAIRRNAFDVHEWIPAVKQAGMPPGPPNGFHALRHYFASVLLSSGVDIRTLAEYLGHHDPGFTLRTYTHLMPGAGGRMKKAIDDVLNDDSEGPGKARQS